MAEQRDRFAGAWAVVEHVFDPSTGAFVGMVRQRRLVETLDDGRLRVTQVCDPDAALAGHPMAGFVGEWVFDLAVDGDDRLYLGPDVVGSGRQWVPGAMTGQGQWPRFGHDFESYSVLVAPDRQLTGGFFSLAGRSVADIIGVAAPETGAAPSLDLDAAPPTLDPEVWPVRRTIGPMAVGAAWDDARTRRRIWAMTDPVGGHEIAITETLSGSDRTVSITAV